MTIFINGSPQETSATTLPDLVAQLAMAPETLLIEHNGVALHRSEWPETRIDSGDRLEILRVAAGG